MRAVFALILAVFTVSVANSQNVDEDELKRRDLSSIVFRNYVGPLTVVNSAQEIRAIGSGLGAGVQGQERFTWAGKYSIVRVYAPEDPKLSADVLILEPTARVDHINGLNLIVAGYLERVFNYSREDAALLANFVTRYNALYRGDMNFFSETFAQPVNDLLSPENAGLSTYYADWPGKTRVVIPLRTSISAGPRGQIDADEVSRPEVTENLPDTPEAIQERREIVNLREREIQEEEEAIREREEELNRREEPQTTITTTSRPEQPNTNSETTQPENNNTNPQNQQNPTNPDNTQPETTQPTTNPQTTPEQQELEQAKEELARREENLQRDREQIAQDEEQAAATQPAATPEREQVEPVLFLSVEGDGTFSRLMILDAKGRKSLVQSELNSIRGRRFENVSDGYLVIAGREGGDAAVRLLVMDKEKLGILRQGADDIHPNSDLVVQGQSIYAAVKDGTEYKLGVFNTALELQKKSAASISPQTAIQLDGNRILVQGPDGKVLFLNPATLEQTAEVTP